MFAKKLTLVGAAIAMVAIFSVAPASANFTFANYDQFNATPTFSFNSATGMLTASGIVNFNYTVANSSIYGNTIVTAAFLLSGKVDGPVTMSGNVLLQNLQNISASFTDISSNNLLTISNFSAANGATAYISGRNAGHSASISGTTDGGDDIRFTSDFLTFDNSQDRSMSFSLSSLLPLLTKNAGTGNLNDFTASSSGTFSAHTNPVPELSTLIGLSGMLTGGGLLTLRRRRQDPS